MRLNTRALSLLCSMLLAGYLLATVSSLELPTIAPVIASSQAYQLPAFKPSSPIIWSWERFKKQVQVTAYNATIQQCDSTPGILADGTHINPYRVSHLRYCALSRNLLKRWGGHFQFGDTIVLAGIGQHSGYWVVKDVMASRWSNRVDLLMPMGITRIESNRAILYSHSSLEQ